MTIPGYDQNPLRVNRSLLKASEDRMLSYFWFPSRGRDLVNAWELKFYTFWDSLTQRRTDGALVRLITRIYPGETVEDAEERLQGFLGEALPVLDDYLPD